MCRAIETVIQSVEMTTAFKPHCRCSFLRFALSPSEQNKKFSDFVDKQTGYKTKCMLTFPVVADKECLGVVMALNKIGAAAFTAEDEKVKLSAVIC